MCVCTCVCVCDDARQASLDEMLALAFFIPVGHSAIKWLLHRFNCTADDLIASS